ncbi:MAG: histidine kinase [Chitinophagaceae bacterium]
MKRGRKHDADNCVTFGNFKYLPYVIILKFTLAVSVIRYFVITEWSLGLHILVFFTQLLFLTLTWKLIERLSAFLDKRIPFSQSLRKRVTAQIFLSVFCLAPFAFLLLYGYRSYMPVYATPQFLVLVGALFLIIIVLINFIYYFKYFFERWQQSVLHNAELQVKAAQLEKEKSLMQYHHLKNQVNPHFMFNAFTSLDGLIHSNPDLASDFIRHLSKVYRYVLEHKENEVVTVQTECGFIQNYISLLNIRFKDALYIHLHISPAGMEKGIVMVTLQMLIDNALKHNKLEESSPLVIKIWDNGDILSVRNNKQLRKHIELSTRHGLQHLKQLYTYLSKVPVTVTDAEEYFEVNLPLL